ncbi:hypothetical protein [Streptomyces diastaticus]
MGELEGEEGRLPPLELRGGGKNVIGLAAGLGQGDVDDDDQIEGGKCLG